MIKLERTDVMNLENAMRGARNPMNSWAKSDSYTDENGVFTLGDSDLDLAKRLCNAGSDHRKFIRQIFVSVDITAPLYWWKEFDTYKVGSVANSCSTMHKIHAKEFALNDFSCEHLTDLVPGQKLMGWTLEDNDLIALQDGSVHSSISILRDVIIEALNFNRDKYLKTKDKKYWWQLIQLLPSSYNQKRTVMLNYEVLANIYKSRRNHKLDEWVKFCKWIETLPYADLITGKETAENESEG